MARKRREDKSGAEPVAFGSLHGAFAKLGFSESVSTESAEESSIDVSEAQSSEEKLFQLLKKGRTQEEKKGRAGKWVTVISGLNLEEHDAAQLQKLLGKKLGCRAFLENEDVVLSGKQKARLEELESF